MTIGTALVVIVAIIAFSVMRMVRYTTVDGRRSPSPPADDGTRAQLTREVEQLRDRVRVLERIATESNTATAVESRKIAEEIEALRDRQA